MTLQQSITEKQHRDAAKRVQKALKDLSFIDAMIVLQTVVGYSILSFFSDEEDAHSGFEAWSKDVHCMITRHHTAGRA